MDKNALDRYITGNFGEDQFKQEERNAMADRTVDEYAARFKGLVCRWDNAPLSGRIHMYNHEGGWLVAGFEMPQWISMRCTKCSYDWSLNKLPVLQNHADRLAYERNEERPHDKP